MHDSSRKYTFVSGITECTGKWSPARTAGVKIIWIVCAETARCIAASIGSLLRGCIETTRVASPLVTRGNVSMVVVYVFDTILLLNN